MRRPRPPATSTWSSSFEPVPPPASIIEALGEEQFDHVLTQLVASNPLLVLPEPDGWKPAL